MARVARPTVRYGVCQNALRMGSLVEDARVATDSGAQALAVLGPELTTLGTATVRAVLADAGLGVSTVMGLNGWSLDGTADDERLMAEAMEQAAALGAAGVLVVSGPVGSRSVAEASEALLRRLESVAPLAAARGVSLALEPLHPLWRSLSFAHTLGHAAALAGRVDGVKLVVDVAHLWEEPSLLTTFADHVDLVATVQVADVDCMAVASQSYVRTQLGEGGVDLGRILKGFLAAGYDGYFENEVICPVPRDERPAFFRKGHEIFDQILA